MKFAELKKHLKTESLGQVYFISGDDSFLINTAIGHFKSLITEMVDFNVSEIVSCVEPRTVIESCETLPILSDKRLVVCYDYKGNTEPLVDYIKKPNDSTILVFVNEKLTENFSAIINLLTIVDCNKLESSSIKMWIRAKVKELNGAIEEDASMLLIEYCASNMARVSRETEKLAFYKSGNVITRQDVVELVTADVEYQVFQLSEAVATRNNVMAGKVLKELMLSSIPPVTLLGMVYAHFRRLLYCAINPSDGDLSKKLGVKEFAVTKSKEQAKKYTPLRLKKICDDFHIYDNAIKNGELADKMALETFVLKTLAGV